MSNPKGEMRREADFLVSKMAPDSSINVFISGLDDHPDPKDFLHMLGFRSLATDEGIQYLKDRFSQ